MNKTPTNTSDNTVARPTASSLPQLSSASVEIPSKPRKDSTAIEVAPATVDIENTRGSYMGLNVRPPAPAPPYKPISPRTTNSASVTNSIASMYRLTRAVNSIPSKLTTALNEMKPASQIHAGTAGKIGRNATALIK